MPNRPRMNFKKMGIERGQALRYIDDPSIAVTVHGIRTVLFGGEEMALMTVTQQIRGVTYDIRPADYWTHNGRLLPEIYEETYPKK
jgi:hypothetical protein